MPIQKAHGGCCTSRTLVVVADAVADAVAVAVALAAVAVAVAAVVIVAAAFVSSRLISTCSCHASQEEVASVQTDLQYSRYLLSSLATSGLQEMISALNHIFAIESLQEFQFILSNLPKAPFARVYASAYM